MVADQEVNIKEEQGELLVVRRDPISFQTNEEEPKDDTPHSKDENVTILTSLPYLQIPQKNPRRLSLFLTKCEPSLMVSYHQLSSFRYWKFIDQTDWEAQLIYNKFFEWLILVIGLCKASFEFQS